MLAYKCNSLIVKVELDRQNRLFVKHFFCQFVLFSGVLRTTNQWTISRISSGELDEENFIWFLWRIFFISQPILLSESSNYPLWNLQQIISTNFFFYSFVRE